jgi:pimeloyl-ACP methyl ester carboxylesterase
LPPLESLRYVRTDALEVAYYEAGPSDGEVALVLHGFPYDIHSYVDVIPPARSRSRLLVLLLLPDRARPSRSHSEQARNREGDLDAKLPELAARRRNVGSTAVAFDNPDYVDVVLHSYRHRLGLSPGRPPYEEIEERLAEQPAITVPAVTLDGLADGNFPATDGSASAHLFTGPRVHRQAPNAGHNLPQEAPDAFASAIPKVANLGLANLRSPSGGA